MIGLIFAILVSAGFYLSEIRNESAASASFAANDSIAASMVIYQDHLVAYHSANPGFSGSAPTASLALPTWFVPAPGLKNYIAGGVSYSYFTNSAPGMAEALYHKTQSMNVGTVQSGYLYSPMGNNTGTVIPAVIPNGSLVYLQ